MTSAAPAFRLEYVRGLDGLRGVSILLVLAAHGYALSDDFAFIGVNTFFVLSGFLITSLLVLEWQASGKISFSAFYLRRALRLLPALFAMLVAFTVYTLFTTSGKELAHNLHEVLWALFYFTNWARVFCLGSVELAPTWSLSVEEQFYIIWPLLLLILLRKNSGSSLLCWLFLGVLLSVTTRTFLLIGNANVPYNSPDRLSSGLDTRADSLLSGCFIAILLAFNFSRCSRFPKRVLGVVCLLAVLGLVWLGRIKTMNPQMVYFGWLAESVFAAIIILQITLGSGTLIHWILENPILVYIGRISYGLYIWHYPIIKAMQRYNLPWAHLLYLIPSFAVAIGSFYLIESPCLRLKKRFQRVPTGQPIDASPAGVPTALSALSK